MPKPDQQGYLGHLEDKSKEELIDLLKRQERLVKNQKFIHRLPDKGEKIQHMVQRLHELIAQQEDIDDTADQFEKMALGAERARRQRAAQGEEEEEEGALLRQIINRGTVEKVYVNEAQHRDGDIESETFVNAYDKVIKKVDASKTKPRYLPNRSIHASNVHELVERIGSLSVLSEGKPLTSVKCSIQKTPEKTKSSETIKVEQSQSQDVTPTCSALSDVTDSPKDPKGGSTVHSQPKAENSGLRCRYDDLLESAMPKSKPKHEAAKMISLADAMQLQLTQQRKHAEAQARHAAEQLSHSLQLGMCSFDPEGASGVSLRYREIRDEVDMDSDDDLDAPD